MYIDDDARHARPGRWYRLVCAGPCARRAASEGPNRYRELLTNPRAAGGPGIQKYGRRGPENPGRVGCPAGVGDTGRAPPGRYTAGIGG